MRRLSLRLGRPKGRPQAPFQPSHENRYPFTNWSTFAPPKWSKFTPPLTNLPFNEWTEIFGSERLTGALLDRLTHHVHILEMNGESFRLTQSKKKRARS